MGLKIGFELCIGNLCVEQVGPGGDWDNAKILQFAQEALSHHSEEILYALDRGLKVDIKFHNAEECGCTDDVACARHLGPVGDDPQTVAFLEKAALTDAIVDQPTIDLAMEHLRHKP